MKKKEFKKIIKQTPEERYRYFLDSVARSGVIWFLFSEKEGFVTMDFEGYINLLIWPDEVFCDLFHAKNAEPDFMKVEEFLSQCESLDDSVRFMVFPNKKNSYVSSVTELMLDLYETINERK